MNNISIYILTLLIFTYFNAESQGRRKLDKHIPILAWEWKASPEEITIARYKELKKSGITYDFTFFSDIATMKKVLKIANKVGIKMIVSCPELKSYPPKVVNEIMNNPALAGYFLRDEPGLGAFHGLSKWLRKISAMDKKHFCYINLFPNYATKALLGTKTYQAYVDSFIAEVPVQFLSFDHYPVIGDSIRWNWYENLEIFSRATRNTGKPFWAFALTLALGPYHVPTLAELKLEVFSDLAYGAQGIQYFRYWTPTNATMNPHRGPITKEHKRSEVYDRIKIVNKEIRDLSWVFLGAKVISIAQKGSTIPVGINAW